MKKIIITLIVSFFLIQCTTLKEVRSSVKIPNQTEISNIKHNFYLDAIDHASAVFTLSGLVFYIDPVGGAAVYQTQPSPDYILITHEHGDHLNIPTLEGVINDKTKIITTQKVKEMLPAHLQSLTWDLKNGEELFLDNGSKVEAIAAYNLRAEALKYHPKGQGNGYVLSRDEFKVYFSGDTEDVPEMRNLKDIDIAFVCMNLPWTMPVERAIDGVLAFKPKQVVPYHYRNEQGFSNIEKFKDEVESKNSDIQVKFLKWYN